MNRFFTVAAVVLFTSSLGSAASAQHVPDDETIPWGSIDNGYKIALSGPSTVRRGEPIPVTVWIGTTTEGLRIALPRFVWTVLDAKGEVIPQLPIGTGGFYSGSGIPGTDLRPGSAVRYKMDIYGRFHLEPGTYTVTVGTPIRRAIDELKHPGNAQAFAHPVSRPITVTIE